tara:strand:- start:103 stop:492 length:390 start_codon:yes stop_codon:yes gene_type:complete
LLKSSISYSQTLVYNKTDTTICFTINQSKFLLKNSISLKAYKSELDLADTLLLFKDSLLMEKDTQLNYWLDYKLKSDSLSILSRKKTTILKEELTIQRKLLKKEKRAKFMALFVGIVATSITTTLWITK